MDIGRAGCGRKKNDRFTVRPHSSLAIAHRRRKSLHALAIKPNRTQGAGQDRVGISRGVQGREPSF